MGQSLVGGVPNHLGVGLKKFDAEKPIVVWRLVFRLNAKPSVIRVKGVGRLIHFGFTRHDAACATHQRKGMGVDCQSVDIPVDIRSSAKFCLK